MSKFVADVFEGFAPGVLRNEFAAVDAAGA